MCDCAYVMEDRVDQIFFPLFTLVLRQGLTFNLEFTDLSRLAVQWGPGTILSLWERVAGNGSSFCFCFFPMSAKDTN